VNGRIKDATGSNDLTYFIIIGVLLVGAGLTFVSKAQAKPKEPPAAAPAPAA
jgi:LPXTG-motif cell wall-anchored protein